MKKYIDAELKIVRITNNVIATSGLNQEESSKPQLAPGYRDYLEDDTDF